MYGAHYKRFRLSCVLYRLSSVVLRWIVFRDFFNCGLSVIGEPGGGLTRRGGESFNGLGLDE